MAVISKIEWCDATFSPWEGCEKISPACANCYAETRDKRMHGGAHWGPNGTRKMMSEAYWKQPLKWNREADCNCGAAGMPPGECAWCAAGSQRPRVFCASLADVFEDRPELIDPRHRLMMLIEQTPNLDWLLLTKRPENVADSVPVKWFGDGFPSNLWIGTTVENQAMAERRIPELMKIPARVRFLSLEPLLEGVKLRSLLMSEDHPAACACGHDHGFSRCPDYGHVSMECHVTGCDCIQFRRVNGIHQIIAGGESGANARPSHPDWFRQVRNDCAATGTAFFFKQWGEWIGGQFDRRKSKMVCQGTEAGKDFGRIFWTNPGQPKVHLWEEADHYWTNASARVGKKDSGRLLDGKEWNESPGVSQ